MENKYKKGTLVLFLLGFILSACATKPLKPVSPQPTQRIDLADDLYLRQIGDGAFVITHSYPWPANSLLVEMPDGTLVLAGTPYTPDATRFVLNWAKQKFGNRKVVAIDTGYHVDNLGGNQALIDDGIPVYGSDLTVQLLQERGEKTRQLMLSMIGNISSPYYSAYQKMVLIPPDHIFTITKGLVLNFGGEDVQVIYPGASQAPDKVVVYFPNRKLLFGSCMILGNDTIGNTADADMKKWPDAIRNLQKYSTDVIVPGHGDRFDPGLIQHTLDLLAKAP
jgi:metallo-beta-lactamase class B